MAVSMNHLATEFDNIDDSSFVTSSITIPANNLALAWVGTQKATTPESPTISGWTQVATVLWSTNAAPARRLTLFRSLTGSERTGALTIDYGGITQLGALWSVVSYSGIVTTGANGADAIVQSVTGFIDAGNSNPSHSLTNPPAAGNAVGGAVMANNESIVDTSGGWTLNPQTSYPNILLCSYFKDTNDQSIELSLGANARWAVISVEIAAEVSVGGSGATGRKYRKTPRTAVMDRAIW